MGSKTNGVLRQIANTAKSVSPSVVVPSRTIVLIWESEANRSLGAFKAVFPGQILERSRYSAAYADGRVLTVGGKPFVYRKPTNGQGPAYNLYVSCVERNGRVEYKVESEAKLQGRLKAETHAADRALFMAQGYRGDQIEALERATAEGQMKVVVDWVVDVVQACEKRLTGKVADPRKDAKGALRTFLQALFQMKATETEIRSAFSAIGIQTPAEHVGRSLFYGAKVVLNIGLPDEQGTHEVGGLAADGDVTTAEPAVAEDEPEPEGQMESEVGIAEGGANEPAPAAETEVEAVGASEPAADPAINGHTELPQKKSRRKKAETVAA